MSDGKSLEPVKSPENAFEILVEVDKKYSSFALRLERLEKGFDFFKLEINKLDSLQLAQDNHSSEVRSISAVLDDLKSNALKSLSDKEKAIDALKNSYQELLAQLKSTKRDFDFSLSAIQESIGRICDRHSEMKSSFVDLADHQIGHKKIHDKLDDYQKQLSDLKVVCDRQKIEMQRQADLISLGAKQLAAKDDGIALLEKSQKQILVILNEKAVSISEATDFKLLKERESLQKALNALKLELSASPQSLESLKSSLGQKLEIIEMDVSNALIKAGNGEQQLKLIDRKLENLQLLVKKLEIEKG